MSPDMHATSRLTLWQSAWVVARRDFLAILFSRAFLFFLLGPLFMIAIAGISGSIGGQIADNSRQSEVGLAMEAEASAAMLAAHEALAPDLGGALPSLREIPADQGIEDAEAARAMLEAREGNYAAILTGTLAEPVLTGPEDQVQRWDGRIALLIASASGAAPASLPVIPTEIVSTSGANERSSRVMTAQLSQMLLFLLTMLLAGMVLSNLVEEKSNKIIEILAAAIPMDAVFLGKLFAMLGVSFVGIGVWGSMLLLVGGVSGFDPASIPTPAVGWPLFIALGVIYFAMAYLLLGSLFLTIGAMASTVREVQTLSMPVTMLQLAVFFLASFALTQPGSLLELTAVAFPLSSPFAMLARAAQDATLWTHAAALLWQAMWVGLIVKMGATLFRRRVMKSGPQGAKKGRFGFGRKRATPVA